MTASGIVYVASGESYVAEATVSAASARGCMPAVPITVFCDRRPPEGACFDEVVVLEDPRPGYIVKIPPLSRSPYERTLFLDSDTYVAAEVGEIFELLDRFDVVAAHDTWRTPFPATRAPRGFAVPNTGVLGFRRSAEVSAMLRAWLELYEQQLAVCTRAPGGYPVNDQSALCTALWESGLSYYVLPSEYNFQLWCPQLLAHGASPRIIHGRGRSLLEIARQLQIPASYRVTVPDGKQLLDGTVSVLGRPLPRLLRLARALARVLRAVSPLHR